MKFLRHLLTAFFLAAWASVNAQNAPLAGFDAYVNQAINDWEVPGVAIAVVKDDKVVFAKGYGVRKVGDPAPVDERTLFAIGSTSKAFTAAAIAMLIDEGKLKWDDRVTKYLPGFELYDPYATRELTIRDLLSHRSGLPGGDLVWYGTERGRDEVLHRVRYLRPASSLRSRFGYQNIMFLAAGQIVAKVSGLSWDEFIRLRFFQPLGMTASNTSIRELNGNVASPHDRIGGKITAIPYRSLDNIAPAGAINSNVAEVAEWVRLQLGRGSIGNRRLISEAAIKEMQSSQTVMRADSAFSLWYPGIRFVNYGLGWILSDYRGRKVVEHVGSIDGMRAQVALIPEENLGLVVLSSRGTSLPTALSYRIFDAFLAAPPRDWSSEMLAKAKASDGQEDATEKRLESARVKGTQPTLKPEEYAGKFANDLYGDVTITLADGRLGCRFGPTFTGELRHWHYDTFRASMPVNALAAGVFVTFALNAKGKIDALTLDITGNYPFKRVEQGE